MSFRRFVGLVLLVYLLQGRSTSLFAQIDTVYICNQGDSVRLQAPQGYFAYQWTPTLGLDNPTIPNPIARLYNKNTYVVKIITDVIGENLIVNPDFEAGNVGFESDYVFVNSIFIQGVYGINESAFNLNETYFEDCPDHTTGSSQMLVVDGSPRANERIWCQNIAVEPNSDYAFSVWLTSVNPLNPPVLQFSINGEPLGPTFKAGFRTCEWRQFYETWNSWEATEAEICVVNQNTNPNGNDFAMDDFAFQKIAGVLYDTTVVLIEAFAKAKERLVYFPDAFSPNFDGINDQFGPFFGKGVNLVEEFKIFDRWGNELFSVSNVSPYGKPIAWDGKVNGEYVDPGMYVYFAKILFVDQHTQVFKGGVRLIR